MKLSFVLARPTDLELLVDLMRQLREDDPAEGAFNESNARNATPALISDPSLGRLWLIECDGAVAGYVALTLVWSLEFGGRIAFVDELFVARSHRGRGIGRATLEFVEDKAKALQATALMLECTVANDPARRLYSGCGYSPRNSQLMVKRIAAA